MNEVAMADKRIGYIRVSTVHQNIDRQLEGMHLDKVFEEKVSAKTKNRPKLQEMLNYIRDGDTVVVHDISRLARNIQDLHFLVEEITSKGASLRFVKEGLWFSSDKSEPMNVLLLSMLGAVYQFEREIMRERQKEGIAAAKAKGKFKGRKKTIDDEEIIRLVNEGKSIRKVADVLGISLSSVQRAKRERDVYRG